MPELLPQERLAVVAEQRLILQYAANRLSEKQRIAVAAILRGQTLNEAAEGSDISPRGIWMAQQAALAKMRRRLVSLGVHSCAEAGCDV